MRYPAPSPLTYDNGVSAAMCAAITGHGVTGGKARVPIADRGQAEVALDGDGGSRPGTPPGR